MSDLAEVMQQHQAGADAFLAGRQTFGDMRGYWPLQTDPDWRNSTLISGDPVEAVRALKEQPGKDIVLTGSISLGHTLIAAGLVDEYRLFVYPVVQGRGIRLFPDGYEIPRLQLLEAHAFVSGISLLVHAPQR